MIKPEHLRSLIQDVLEAILPEMNSPEAVELLMITAAQESWCGRYLQQEGCGVALGIFQIEPATYRDIFDNFLVYNDKWSKRMFENFQVNKRTFRVHLKGNLPYQICLARLQYYRFPESIPVTTNDRFKTLDGKINFPAWEHALARYYKKYWNTEEGAATIPEVLRNYDKYAK